MTLYDDADLLAYLDGAAPPEAAAEIERSPELMARVRALARLEADLRARLFRVDCPDPRQLGEYHLGLLAADLAGQIRRHVARCPHCMEELRQIEAFMAPGPFERVRVIIASLLSGGLVAGLPVSAGVRGGEPGPLVYTAGSFRIILDIQPAAGRPERRSLTGMVIGDLPGRMETRLVAADQPLAAAQVGELGDFAFADLAPGTFAIYLATAEEEIRIPPFVIE